MSLDSFSDLWICRDVESQENRVFYVLPQHLEKSSTLPHYHSHDLFFL